MGENVPCRGNGKHKDCDDGMAWPVPAADVKMATVAGE